MTFAGACWTSFPRISPWTTCAASWPRSAGNATRPTPRRTGPRAASCCWPNRTTKCALLPSSQVSQRVLFPVRAQPEQRHRGRALRPVPERRRQLHLLRDLHRLRRQDHPAAVAGDAGLRPFQVQHAQRPRRAEQGHGAVPAQNQRPVRHALAPGRREHPPDVLRQHPFLADAQAAAAARAAVGIRQDRQLRLAHRDGGRLAGAEPRRRPDAEVLPRRVPARP